MIFDLQKINITSKKIIEAVKFALSNEQVGFHDPELVFLYSKDSYRYHNISFAQEGEDMILSRFFGNQPKGFYIDVGAFHPQRYSNTYHFYLKGWRGINIDPMPGSMDIFNQVRPEDINLELAISNQKESLNYYQFNEPALNGFSDEISQYRDGWRSYKIIGSQKIATYTLTEILDRYMPIDREIDFMSVDVEGLDLKVLQSNDWEKYRPKIVLAEDLKFSLNQEQESPLVRFMQQQDYQLYAKSVYTLFFTRK